MKFTFCNLQKGKIKINKAQIRSETDFILVMDGDHSTVLIVIISP